VAPSAVFEFLLASSGAIALLVYLVIAASHLVLRKKREARGEVLSYRMWLFPGLTWATIVFIIGVLGSMLFNQQHRPEIIATAILTLLVLAASRLVHRKRAARRHARMVAVRS